MIFDGANKYLCLWSGFIGNLHNPEEKMRFQKLIASGVALGLLFGGGSLAAANATVMPLPPVNIVSSVAGQNEYNTVYGECGAETGYVDVWLSKDGELGSEFLGSTESSYGTYSLSFKNPADAGIYSVTVSCSEGRQGYAGTYSGNYGSINESWELSRELVVTQNTASATILGENKLTIGEGSLDVAVKDFTPESQLIAWISFNDYREANAIDDGDSPQPTAFEASLSALRFSNDSPLISEESAPEFWGSHLQIGDIVVDANGEGTVTIALPEYYNALGLFEVHLIDAAGVSASVTVDVTPDDSGAPGAGSGQSEENEGSELPTAGELPKTGGFELSPVAITLLTTVLLLGAIMVVAGYRKKLQQD